MPEQLTITIDGDSVTVAPGTTVAAAVMIADRSLRTSVTGEPRGPLCGMGVCFECRLAINGTPHARSCQVLCEEGMQVRTDA